MTEEVTPQRFIAAEVVAAIFRDSPHVDYERFRADLDAVASQDSTPRG